MSIKDLPNPKDFETIICMGCGEIGESCDCTKNWTTAEVAELPTCDICFKLKFRETGNPVIATQLSFKARYDSKLKDSDKWAYFCERHFISDSHQKLGMGLGQRLEVAE